MDYKQELLDQLQLPYLPPHNDTATSQKSAIEIAEKFHKSKDQILQFIIICKEGGATYSELCQYFKMRPQTVSSITNNLWLKEDKIRKSGRCRASEDSGSDNEVWLATEFSPNSGKHPGYKKVQTDKNTLEIYEKHRDKIETNGKVAERFAKFYDHHSTEILRKMAKERNTSPGILLLQALVLIKQQP